MVLKGDVGRGVSFTKLDPSSHINMVGWYRRYFFPTPTVPQNALRKAAPKTHAAMHTCMHTAAPKIHQA